MTNKEIKNLAEIKIKEGKTRQQTFDEIKQETKQPSENIAKIVRFIPTLESRGKFKTANSVLGIILVITGILKILAGLPIIMQLDGIGYLPLLLLFPIINIILAVGVYQFKGTYYRSVIFLTVIGLLNSMKDIIGVEFNPLILVDLGIAAALIGLGVFLGSKLVPNYELKKVKYRAQNGSIRVKQKYQFTDLTVSTETLD